MWALIGGSAAGGFILKALWSYFTDSKKEEKSDLKLTLQRLDQTIGANTIALVKLEAQMENLWKQVNQIPELAKDQAAMGEKLRGLQKELNGQR